MTSSTIDELFNRIYSFLQKHPEVDEQQFGWQSIKERGLVNRLLNGGDVTTKKLDAINAFMASYQPKE